MTGLMLPRGMNGRPGARGTAEGVLARLAANFPDLVDPDCERAKELYTQSGELITFLEEEFAAIGDLGPAARGDRGRLSCLLFDRARNGKPPSPYIKA